MGYLSELDAWVVAMGPIAHAYVRGTRRLSPVRPNRPLVARAGVLNRLICTRIESGTDRYGRTELNLRDLRTWVWAMGPVAHLRNVGPRQSQDRTTRGGATPQPG